MGFRILLCVDSSNCAASAATLALNLLAGIEDGELTVMHVVNVVQPSGNLLKDLPGRLGFEPAVVSKEEGERQDEVGRTVLGQLKVDAQQRGLELTTVLEHGAVVERITHWADKGFDLLMLGLKGETNERYPGSGGASVHNVLTGISIPALLVPHGVSAITGVAVGYDGSPAALRTIEAVRPLVTAFDFPVFALYVSADGSGGEILAEVPDRLENDRVRDLVVQGDVVHEALAATAEEVGANVLAVGFKGHSRLKDFVFGSAAEYIVSNTNLIVLVSH